MWYKTAKQGSVWSRISPDAENIFDALLDNATKINKDKKYIILNPKQILNDGQLSDFMSLIEKRKKDSTLIGGLIGTEGSHALDGELENIKKLYDHGFRMMSLHHFFDVFDLLLINLWNREDNFLTSCYGKPNCQKGILST